MKGFIAQCLDAARTLDSARLKRPLVFVFTASEEVGCLGAYSVALALKEILGETPVPRLAWIGEPTSYAVCHAHKSNVALAVTVRGIGGHSGVPASGVNAIAVMARVIDTIGRFQQELAARRHPQYAAIFPDVPYDVLNFGTVQGGIALNMIAEECKLRLSYRTLPNADPLNVYHEIGRRLRALDGHDYAGREHRAKIEIARSEPGASAGLSARDGAGSRAVRGDRRQHLRRRALRHRRRMVHLSRISPRSSAAPAISSRRISPTSTSAATPSNAAPR